MLVKMEATAMGVPYFADARELFGFEELVGVWVVFDDASVE